MYRLMDCFRFCRPERIFVELSTLDEEVDQLHNVSVHREEGSVVRVRGDNGAEQSLQHQHW